MARANNGILIGEVGGLLASLLDKSLVVRDDQGRYAMLESLREYGRGKLEDEKDGAQVEGRFADLILELAESADVNLVGPDEAEWLDRLELERENLRSALDRSVDPVVRLRIVAAVWRFWQLRGYVAEGRRYVAEALAAAGEGAEPALRCRAMNAAGGLAWMQEDVGEALCYYEQALAISSRLGNRRQQASLLNNLGNVAQRQRDFPRSRAFFEQALAINRKLGNRRGMAANMNNLATILKEQEEFATAESLYREALEVNRSMGNRTWMATNLSNLSLVAQERGDIAGARALAVEALGTCVDLGNRTEIAQILEALASMDVAVRPERAARLWGAAARLREEAGTPMPLTDREGYGSDIAAVRAALGNRAFTAAWKVGEEMTIPELETAVRDSQGEA